MAIDIFNPKISVIAEGLEGKVIMIYGANSLGKTSQAVRFPKPYVIAAELGLNGISGVPYQPVTKWSDFVTIVKQFTGPNQKKAREHYSTIIIDEVYATSIYCQEYIRNTIGNGALTMADGDSKRNLYQAYEIEYFKQINLLTSAGYTVVFIAHAQKNTQTGKITPKGDKRCMDPILDKCDYVAYLKSNGVNNEGRIIKSSAYLAETAEFFARARIEYTPTFIPEFTMENLTAAIQEGIDKKRIIEGATVTSFEEQQKLNKTTEINFEQVKNEVNEFIFAIPGSNDNMGTTPEGKYFINYWVPLITQIIEKYLGVGGKISNCNSNQKEALVLILNDLKTAKETMADPRKEPNSEA